MLSLALLSLAAMKLVLEIKQNVPEFANSASNIHLIPPPISEKW